MTYGGRARNNKNKGEKGKRKNGETEKEITKANKALFASYPFNPLIIPLPSPHTPHPTRVRVWGVGANGPDSPD